MENVLPSRNIIRRCSFCRCPFHNILSCNHHSLTNFQNHLLQKKTEILRIEGISLFEKITLFESWLLYQCMFGNSNVIKAYAIRYLGCSTRERINVSMQKISIFIWGTELNLQEEEEGNNLNENDNIIEWVIDRSGDPSLLPNSTMNICSTKIHIVLEEESKDLNSLEECSICYENKELNNIVKLNCSHEFCGCCVKKIINSEIKKCAFCRISIDCIKVKNDEMKTLLIN